MTTSSRFAFCLYLLATSAACDGAPIVGAGDAAGSSQGAASGAGSAGYSNGMSGSSSLGAADAGGPSEPEGCVPGRALIATEVVNGRDIGGVLLVGGSTVACGEIYRAASLANLTAVGCAEFEETGIRTVIDLRMPSEVSAAPNASCVDDTAIQIAAPMPIPYNVSAADYIADLDAVDSVAAAFEVFGDEEAYPIYFHCTYGRDRSGVLAAIVLLTLGADREEILIEYLRTRLSGLSAFPASLAAVLDEIENRGGVEAYLAAAGVAPESIETLRAVAIAP